MSTHHNAFVRTALLGLVGALAAACVVAGPDDRGFDEDDITTAKRPTKPAADGGAATALPSQPGPQAPAVDGGTPTPIPTNDAAAPIGTGNTPPLACPPVAPVGLTTSYGVPNKVRSCTTTQVDAMYTACFGPSNSTAACNQFRSANAACSTCMATPVAAPSWGVYLYSDKYSTYNIGGCVDILGGTPLASCARAMASLVACEKLACVACKGTEADACDSASESGVCAQLATAWDAACATLPTSPAATCTKGMSAELFRTLGTSMCGS